MRFSFAFAAKKKRTLTLMYGPPQDCKGEVRKKKVSLPQMYPAS